MGRSDGGAERAGWRLAKFFERINTAGWTWRNFAVLVELDVRRNVTRKVDGLSIFLAFVQCKLIGGGIYLTQVVDASVNAACCDLIYFGITVAANAITRTQIITNSIDFASYHFSLGSLMQLSKYRPANSVAIIYRLRPPGAKW